jgi:acetyl-CoA carboxylase biotin carboxylase subunit
VRKVLIANRGEIAVRVIRGCRDLGLHAVAVYADCDRCALHVRLADEAWPLEGNTAAETYLRIDKLLDLARQSGADAVHPGYGFLSEHAGFAAAVREAGLTYVGPSARAIATMGSKTAARAAAIAANVKVVPGSGDPILAARPDADVAREARELGYPLLIKAVAGGGGKGMRLVESEADLPGALRAARSEALSAFGDAAVYLERQIRQPRHVEVQLLGDEHGVLLPFVERECSIQRRHQKLLEESPSPFIDPDRRRELAAAAVRVAQQVSYSNAGTIEFLLDSEGQFYFLEMNTRLQVEHPVTEAVTGFDLVQWQLRIAAGEPLTLDPDSLLTPSGHAIEARIYAEDPDNGFLPSPGHVSSMRAPSGPGIRDDTGLAAPGEVPVYFDPLISKLIAWGHDRGQAVARMARALREYDVEGVRTTLPFFRWLVTEEDFLAGRVDTEWLDRAVSARRNAGFSTVDDETARVAVIAVAIESYARSTAVRTDWERPSGSTAGESWLATARREALR